MFARLLARILFILRKPLSVFRPVVRLLLALSFLRRYLLRAGSQLAKCSLIPLLRAFISSVPGLPRASRDMTLPIFPSTEPPPRERLTIRTFSLSDTPYISSSGHLSPNSPPPTPTRRLPLHLEFASDARLSPPPSPGVGNEGKYAVNGVFFDVTHVDAQIRREAKACEVRSPRLFRRLQEWSLSEQPLLQVQPVILWGHLRSLHNLVVTLWLYLPRAKRAYTERQALSQTPASHLHLLAVPSTDDTTVLHRDHILRARVFVVYRIGKLALQPLSRILCVWSLQRASLHDQSPPIPRRIWFTPRRLCLSCVNPVSYLCQRTMSCAMIGPPRAMP
jgi:hypothetical protein